jgi:hypothetical protein
MFQNIEELEKQVKEFQKNILASSAFIEGIQNLTNMVESQQVQFDKDAKDVLGAIDTYTKYIKEQTDLLIKSISEQTSKEADDFAKSNEELIAKVKASSEELIKFVTEKITEKVDELSRSNAELTANSKASSEGLAKFVTDKVDELSKSNTEMTSKAKADVDALIKFVTEHTTAKAKEVTDSNSELIRGFESRFVEYEKSLGLLFDRVKADNVKISEDAISAFRTINQEYGKKLDEESALLKELIAKLEIKYNEFIQKLENTNVDMLFAEVQNMKKAINNKFTLLFAGVGVAIALIIVSFFI